ncbi:MAG: TolC family protein [SAR324 cluster bacterium]|nr:TolC family protein [SAR324 cluster bacterium]
MSIYLEKLGLFLCFWIVCLSVATQAQETTAPTIDLRQSIALATKTASETQALKDRELQFQLQEERLEEGKIRHQVSSTLSLTSNDVSDSRDITVSGAADAQQLSTAYRQSFQNGFYWQLRLLQRDETAFDNTSTTFNQFQLRAAMPIYGQGAYAGRIGYEKEKIQLQEERLDFEGEKSSLASLVARRFWDVLISYQEFSQIRMHMVWMKQQQAQQQALAHQNTDLDTQKLQLEYAELQNELAIQEATLRFAREQLAMYIGLPAMEATPLLPEMPVFENTRDALIKLFLERDPAYHKLTTRLELLNRDLELNDAQTDPEITVGGNADLASASASSGTNVGAYVSLVYNFWGGESERKEITLLDIRQLEWQRITQKNNLESEATHLYHKIQMEYKKVEFARQKTELRQQQSKQRQLQFDVGEITFDQLIEARKTALQIETDLISSQKIYWLLLLDQLDRLQLPLSLIYPPEAVPR